MNKQDNLIVNYEKTRQALAKFKAETRVIYLRCPKLEDGFHNCINSSLDLYNAHLKEHHENQISIDEYIDNDFHEGNLCKHCLDVWNRKKEKTELATAHASSKRALSTYGKKIINNVERR